MEGFTIVDGVVTVVIVVSAILAYSRGLVREVMAIVGWVAAAVVAFVFAPSVVPFVAEVPVIGSFLGDSCELATIAAFAAVFAVALVVAALFTPLLSSVIQHSALGGIDMGLGFLFGVLRGIVLVGVAFVVYDRAFVGQSLPMIDNSRSAAIFAQVNAQIEAALPADVPGWIIARYDQLMGPCAAAGGEVAPTPAPPPAN
ncbi:MAG: CvpA family protein [Rhodobacteraceae bacterium]|nr:CvpA family protein [Paracoccaceae bacterium]